MHTAAIIVLITSSVACLCSMAVIATYICFPRLRSRLFIRIIVCMSISDLGMNLCSLLGFPADGTILCWIQGIVQNYFAIASWFWTLVLSYTTYCYVKFGSHPKFTMKHAHYVCWILPAVISLAPLTTNRYGRVGGTHDQWCMVEDTSYSPSWAYYFWAYVSFFGWLLLCVLAMIVMQCIVYHKFMNSALDEVIRQTYKKVWPYPLAMTACWSLNFMWNDTQAKNFEGDIMVLMGMLAGISYGIITAIIFFSKSPNVRAGWVELLSGNSRTASDTKQPGSFTDGTIAIQGGSPGMKRGTSLGGSSFLRGESIDAHGRLSSTDVSAIHAFTSNPRNDSSTTNNNNSSSAFQNPLISGSNGGTFASMFSLGRSSLTANNPDRHDSTISEELL